MLPMRLAGFVSELRDFGKLRFIILRNSEGLYQITLKKEEVSKEVFAKFDELTKESVICLLYTSPSPRDLSTSRMPSSA